MMNLINLKTFDLFQIAVPISYKNSYAYHSNIGGILTIIVFVIIITYSLIKLGNLLDRSAFTITSNQYHDVGGSINLTSTPILLQLLDKTGNELEYDTKLFYFNATYIQTIFENINGKEKRMNKQINLEIERCDKLKKNFSALENFSNYNLTQFMCIKPNQSIILFGMSDDLNSNYKTLQIKINKCIGNNCYDSKIVENIMENSIFTVTYLGQTTDFTNVIIRKNVINKIYTKYVTLSQSLLKRISYGFSGCKLTVYDNIIINHKIEFNYFAYQNSFSDFFIQNMTTSCTLAYFYFNYNGFIIEHTKKISGLGSIFLNICTVFNVVVLVAKNINNYYGNKILFSDIYLNFLVKNGRLRKLAKDFTEKKAENASINGLLSKSIKNNVIIGNRNNNDVINNINLISCRNNNSFKVFNLLDKNKINKKKFDNVYSKIDMFKFYLFPYCLMEKDKKLYQIKEKVNIIFSIENFIDILISNSSQNTLYEQILYYVSNENYGKNPSRDNRSNTNLNS